MRGFSQFTSLIGVMCRIVLVYAHDSEGGIGKGGSLPWRIPQDLRRFREITTEHGEESVVVMGRETWESLPEAHRPLRGRVNVVLSRDAGRAAGIEASGAVCVGSIGEAMERFGGSAPELFVIGGAEVYAAVLSEHGGACCRIMATEVRGDFGCDRFFDPADVMGRGKFASAFVKSAAEWQEGGDGVDYRFVEYSRAM